MKIIEKGNKKPRENRYFQTCKKCGCAFEYNDNDIKRWTSNSTVGYVGNGYFSAYQPTREGVVCPQCRNSMKASKSTDGGETERLLLILVTTILVLVFLVILGQMWSSIESKYANCSTCGEKVSKSTLESFGGECYDCLYPEQKCVDCGRTFRPGATDSDKCPMCW